MGSVDYSSKFHSIYFGDKNTWDDWHLVPSSRPVVAPPSVKTNYIDIPGANGVLDFSEALTGYPLYNQREGSWEFLVMNGYMKWSKLYTEIMNAIHGKQVKVILEDDIGYYYEGRVTVENFQSTVPRSTITFKYNLKPYKRMIKNSLETNWLWDPFSFVDGKITDSKMKNISITSSNSYTEVVIPESSTGNSPINPIITASAYQIYLSYTDEDMNIAITDRVLQKGDNIIPELTLYGKNEYKLYFKGNGKVSIDFRGGDL